MKMISAKPLLISLVVVIAITQIVESQPGRRKKRKKEEIEDVTKQAVNEPSPYNVLHTFRHWP